MENEELVRLYQETKDQKYFEELLSQNGGMIESIVRRMISPNVSIDEDDMRVEAMWGLHSAALKYEAGDALFSTYAFKVIRGSVLDSFTKFQRRAKTVEKLEAEGKVVHVIEPEYRPFGGIEDFEYGTSVVRRMIETLPTNYRFVVHELEKGRSATDIAKTLDCSPQNVSVMIKKIREKTKKVLDRERNMI